MLHMSAAFDTLNHYILISRLHEEAGVSGLYPTRRTEHNVWLLMGRFLRGLF